MATKTFDPADMQAFTSVVRRLLALLDGDRFEGKFRDGVHKVDTSDLMRRMTKEELVKFDGTPLFPDAATNRMSAESKSMPAAWRAVRTAPRTPGSDSTAFTVR